MIREEAINYWVDIAEYDLETAKVMLDGKRYLYVGFMCHQAVEKILKARYVSVNNEIPPYSHNLMFLANKGELFDLFSEDQKDFLDFLDPFNINTRYPDYKDEKFKTLSNKRCKDMISDSETILKWIKAKL